MKKPSSIHYDSSSLSDEEPSSLFKNQSNKALQKKINNLDQLSRLKETGDKLLREGRIVEGLDCYQTSKLSNFLLRK
jgi:hypothetical protein